MAWTSRYNRTAERQLAQLDPQIRRRIVRYMEDRVITASHPTALGQALVGDLRGLWRYRVGDYRVVCEIQESNLIVLAVEIGHRSKVYRQ